MGKTAATVILAVDHETEVVLGRIEAGRAGLALIDAFMRFRLHVRRCGCELHLRDVSDELRALLELVGLDAVAIEPPREPERREEVGVDEVVQPGDPSV
jgi:RecB family endonuclease NucS